MRFQSFNIICISFIIFAMVSQICVIAVPTPMNLAAQDDQSQSPISTPRSRSPADHDASDPKDIIQSHSRANTPTIQHVQHSTTASSTLSHTSISMTLKERLEKDIKTEFSS
ncbi:hypothetical protein ABKN59_010843 [Abortiporus biennis]